jgi:hypothetical protein
MTKRQTAMSRLPFGDCAFGKREIEEKKTEVKEK